VKGARVRRLSGRRRGVKADRAEGIGRGSHAKGAKDPAPDILEGVLAGESGRLGEQELGALGVALEEHAVDGCLGFVER
jgi:hypothetical protein